MTTLIVSSILQIVNIIITIMELALLLRVLLPWFRVPRSHAVMKVLIAITEPILRPLRRAMGNRNYRWSGNTYHDTTPIVAFFALWLIQALLPRIVSLIITPPLWLFSPQDNLERWFLNVIGFLFQIYNLLLLIRILLEWIRVPYTKPIMRFLWDITEPLLAPIRRRLPLLAGLDFSPLVAVLLLSVIQMLVNSLIALIF